MANESKRGGGQGQGQMGNAGKDAGKKPFGSGGGSEESQPGLERDEDEGSGYDIDIEGPTKKDATADTWRDRPLGGGSKQK